MTPSDDCRKACYRLGMDDIRMVPEQRRGCGVKMETRVVLAASVSKRVELNALRDELGYETSRDLLDTLIHVAARDGALKTQLSHLRLVDVQVPQD